MIKEYSLWRIHQPIFHGLVLWGVISFPKTRFIFDLGRQGFCTVRCFCPSPKKSAQNAPVTNNMGEPNTPPSSCSTCRDSAQPHLEIQSEESKRGECHGKLANIHWSTSLPPNHMKFQTSKNQHLWILGGRNFKHPKININEIPSKIIWKSKVGKHVSVCMQVLGSVPWNGFVRTQRDQTL